MAARDPWTDPSSGHQLCGQKYNLGTSIAKTDFIFPTLVSKRNLKYDEKSEQCLYVQVLGSVQTPRESICDNSFIHELLTQVQVPTPSFLTLSLGD